VKEKIGVIPDAAFAIERQDNSSKFRRFFFLEADRGTMPLCRKSLRLSSIRRKALAYSQSRRSRVLRDRFGIPGFQTLFVTRSRERLERMKETCKTASGRNPSIFLYATQDGLKRDDALAVLGVIFPPRSFMAIRYRWNIGLHGPTFTTSRPGCHWRYGFKHRRPRNKATNRSLMK
jgi:hypothetical protein